MLDPLRPDFQNWRTMKCPKVNIWMVTCHKRPQKNNIGEFNNSILSLSGPHIAREFEPSEHLCGDNLELGGWLRITAVTVSLHGCLRGQSGLMMNVTPALTRGHPWWQWSWTRASNWFEIKREVGGWEAALGVWTLEEKPSACVWNF